MKKDKSPHWLERKRRVGKVVGRKSNKFPCREIQNSMLSHGVRVSTDFNNKIVQFNTSTLTSSPEP